MSAGKRLHTLRHLTWIWNIQTLPVLVSLCPFQEVRLENVSLSISRGKAWRWQDEAQRVSLTKTPSLVLSSVPLELVFLTVLIFSSYGIKNRDEVTFMKKLRKKWKCNIKVFLRIPLLWLKLFIFLWFFLNFFWKCIFLIIKTHANILLCVLLLSCLQHFSLNSIRGEQV